MVGAIVELAGALSLEVIAEGVETDAQLAGLHRAGCRMVKATSIPGRWRRMTSTRTPPSRSRRLSCKKFARVCHSGALRIAPSRLPARAMTGPANEPTTPKPYRSGGAVAGARLV